MVREWLSWPTNIFTALPQGNLLLSCREVGWARQQLLRAALLAALSLREARLIVHGFPWTANGFREELLEAPGEVLLSNGPRLQESDVVLARTDAPGAEKLSARFLRGDALGEEHIQLLGSGEAMVIYGEGAVCTRWN